MDLVQHPPNPFTDIREGSVISFAFESNGVNYWEIKDVFNTYSFRAMDALAIYEQWAMRCTDEYLDAHALAVDVALNKGMLTEVAILNKNLKERRAFAIPTEDIIWQFAAVKYFDESESPYKYDAEYGKEKIARWRKDMKVADFFSLQPIRDLIPSPVLSETDLESYLKVTNQIGQSHLQTIFDLLPRTQPNKDIYQALNYAKSLMSTPTI